VAIRTVLDADTKVNKVRFVLFDDRNHEVFRKALEAAGSDRRSRFRDRLACQLVAMPACDGGAGENRAVTATPRCSATDESAAQSARATIPASGP
jgi:hypothetical protein